MELPPFEKAKTCWTCRFSHAETGGRFGTTNVYCDHRYIVSGRPPEDGFVDFVQYDEVCPLWEGRTGEMEIIDLALAEELLERRNR